MRRAVARAVLLSVALFGAARSQDEPVDTDYREAVRVGLVQLEVTAWPKDESNVEACRGLTDDDFQILVNGRPREITAVDWLGEEVALPGASEEGEAAPAAGEQPPLTLVLFFDLWHLNVFHGEPFSCPLTKPIAFDEARGLVSEEFRPGDRLLLVTFRGWPEVHEGWLREPEQALRALDRLEVKPTILQPRKTHSHHLDWIEGMKSLMLALGRYPGRKEIFYLADDFRFDDVALQVYGLAARAQANQVFVHAIDLLESCRKVPGPGCMGLTYGGLGCTEFQFPAALGYVSVNTGGGLFQGSTSLAQAVSKVRQMLGCRYLISFPMLARDGKRAPEAKVRLARKDLKLHAPLSFGNPAREASDREQQNALFLLPDFGQVVRADVGLWPLRPSGKGKRWTGMIVARVQRAPGDPWPENLERIEIETVAHAGSKVYGKFGKVLEGTELERFREGEPRSFVFPVDRIRPGENTVVLRAVGVGDEASANVRASLEVPEPPGPGESGPWVLMDRLARVGDTLTPMPALEGVVPATRDSLVLAYGCSDGEADFGQGRLVALDGDAIVPVEVGWFEEPEKTGNRGPECGWLAGRIGPSLEPGLWRFEPPESLTPDGRRTPTVEVLVTDGR